MKVTYTEEAIADIVEAISYLNERNPTAAAKLTGAAQQIIDAVAALPPDDGKPKWPKDPHHGK